MITPMNYGLYHSMAVKSPENLEKSGIKICIREKLEDREKSGDFTEYWNQCFFI